MKCACVSLYIFPNANKWLFYVSVDQSGILCSRSGQLTCFTMDMSRIVTGLFLAVVLVLCLWSNLSAARYLHAEEVKQSASAQSERIGAGLGLEEATHRHEAGKFGLSAL